MRQRIKTPRILKINWISELSISVVINNVSICVICEIRGQALKTFFHLRLSSLLTCCRINPPSVRIREIRPNSCNLQQILSGIQRFSSAVCAQRERVPFFQRFQKAICRSPGRS